MPSAAVIGGRGQVGRAVIDRLAREGWTITATTSAAAPPDGTERDGTIWLSGMASHAEAVAAAVTGATDVVVDAVAYGAGDAEELLALGSRIGSAVVVSSMAVYVDDQGRSLGDLPDGGPAPRWPVPIVESQPTVAAGDDSYAAGKVALEVALTRRAPFPVTIIRPGAIHGAHSRHLREWYFIKRALDARPAVILPFAGRNVFQPTAVVNLAELVALAAARPGRRVLNCGDDDPPTVAAIAGILSRLLGHRFDEVLVPGPAPAPNVGHHPWGVPHPMVVDMTLSRATLGYAPVAGYDQAIADALPGVLRATDGRDWRDVYPVLASYSGDLFDYDAEDRWLDERRTTEGAR